MRIEAVCYDLDGTLVNTLPGIEAAARVAWHKVLPGEPVPELSKIIGPPVRQMFASLVGDELALKLEAAFRVAYDGGMYRQAQVFPGVVETLGLVHATGRRQWVVTNKPQRAAHSLLRALELDSFFAGIVSPDSRCPRFESKAEALSHLMEIEELRADGMLFVGDTREDRQAAEANGVRFVAVSYGYGAEELKEDGEVCLQTFSELYGEGRWCMR